MRGSVAESRWLRLNTDWHLSEWLVVLSAESRLAWVQLLCHMKTNGFAGTCKSLNTMIAERLWFVNEPSIRQMLQAAQNAGALVIEDDTWTIPAWKKYQGDETHAERQKRYRDKKRDGSDASRTEVTPTETETETVTITETYITPPTPQGEPKPKKFRKPTVLEWEIYAIEIGLPPAQVDKAYDHYEGNGWKTGRTPMKDWKAALRNWKRNYDEWQPKKPTNSPQDTYQRARRAAGLE
jgi:hypothetical protein